MRSWVLSPGSFFQNYGSPIHAKVHGSETYLHKMTLFRVLELHSDGSWNFFGSWVLSPASFFQNHASPNRAKVPGPEMYLHKMDLFEILAAFATPRASRLAEDHGTAAANLTMSAHVILQEY